MERNGGPLGPLGWVDAWTRDNERFVDDMTEMEMCRFSAWFAEEFFPNPDRWRVRIGWPSPSDVFLTPSMTVDWNTMRGSLGPSPTTREGYYRATLVNEWRPGQAVEAKLRAWHGGDVENEPLIRLYWISKFWEWTYSDLSEVVERGRSRQRLDNENGRELRRRDASIRY